MATMMKVTSQDHLQIEERLAQEFAFKPAWLELIGSLYGYDIVHLVSQPTNGQVRGYLPVAVIKTALTGKRVVGLPFTDYSPVIAADAAATNDLVDQAIHLARLEGARYLELRAGPNETLAERADLTKSDLYVRYVLPLDKDPDKLLARARPRMRSQVRKAERDGVSVRWGLERRDIDTFYQLHLQTRSGKHGMPAQPRRYFTGMWDDFAASGHVRLALAEYKGRCIAAAILLIAGGTVSSSYVATDQRYLELNATRAAEWAAIEWACANGYTLWDFGRTARESEGLKQYKRAWGATELDLPYFYSPDVAGLAATSETSRKYALLTACWRKLPLSVAEPLGGRLYRHLG
ncbi:MAG TPA: GNAT family N-acetyltransferase [Ktedonobacterales bacterium]